MSIEVLANGTDVDRYSLSITGVLNEVNGTVVDNGDGTYTYTPNANFNGTGSFDYTLSDGNGGSEDRKSDV